MAPVKSSSKRKSSSSHKKKRSKLSSEAGRKRRSSSRKKDKSKKRSRREASISYSEDDSRTEDSLSVSSSDSEDDYRSRRARSRTRGDAKGSRKRAGRSSLSRDADKDLPNRRKKKWSKRDKGSVERRNSRRRSRGSVRSRKDTNVSSTSDGSMGCSTCRGSSTDSVRSRGRSEERDRYKRSPSKTRDRRYEDRYRFSRSSSSYSTCDHQRSYQSEEKYTGENSRRLKSVLADPKHLKEKEGNRNIKDDDRTEIIQAYDDCPSSRSNDSYDGGRKRESCYQPHGASDKKRRVDDANGEDTSKVKNTGVIVIGKENDGAKDDGNDQNLSMFGSTKTSTRSRSELPSATGSSEVDDLELYLRQKALENLRKFRGGAHTNTKTLQKEESGGDEKLPPTAKTETVRNEPQIEHRSQSLEATQLSQDVTPVMERKSTFCPPKDGLMPDKRHESEVKLDNVHSVKGVGNVVLKQTAVTNKLTEKNKPNVGITVSRKQESSGDQSNMKEAPTSKESSKQKLLEARNILNTSVATNLKASSGSGNTHGVAINDSRLAANEASTIPNSATAVHCQNEQKDEAKGSSQFEQKTMSVMRGGEMVQVSYKVYIPKKAPALARRQLQR